MDTIDKKTRSIENTNPLASLKSKIKTSDPEIQHYVRELEAVNLNCAKKIAKLQAENLMLNNRLNVLGKQLKEKGPSFFDIVAMSDEQPNN